MTASPSEKRRADDSGLRLRKERLHTTMLIELLALLVFMAMAFAFVSREQMVADPLMDRIDKLERDLRARDAQIRALRTEVRSLRAINQQLGETVRRLLNDPRAPLRANARLVMLPEAQFREMIADLSNQADIIQARQQENSGLRARLLATGRGGAGLPNCPVARGYLIAIDAYGNNTFAVTPLWTAAAGPAVARIPGARDLTSGRRLTGPAFQRLADQLGRWGTSQTPPCRFRVRMRQRHGNLILFQRQFNGAGQYFYVHWVSS